MAGVRWNEFSKRIGPIESVKINRAHFQEKPRRPAMSSVGFCDPTAAMPHVDCAHGDSYLAGLCARLLQRRVRPGRRTLAAVRRLSESFAKQFKQLNPLKKICFHEWLAHSSYTGERKQELIKAFERVTGGGDFKLPTHVDSHVKDEQYLDFKFSRLINARPDEFKVLLGPVIHEIEQIVFANASFAKFVAQRDRWAKIRERLDVPGSSVIWTDHTSYEAVFSRDFVLSTALPIYEWILGDHPCKAEFLRLYIRYVIPRDGHSLRSKWWRVEGVQAEMSGEMDTSLKNGLVNVFGASAANALSALAELTGELIGWSVLSDEALASRIDKISAYRITPDEGGQADGEDFRMFAEGDDGVVVAKVETDMSAMSVLGFNVKAVSGPDLTHGDFCSIDGTIEGPAISVRNPLKVLGSFGWLGGAYVDAKRSTKLMIYRASALSLISDHRNSPILGAFAQWVLRATSHVDMSKFEQIRMNKWWRDKLLNGMKLNRKELRLLTPDVPMAARRVIESRYGILIEHQIEIEHYFETLNGVEHIECSTLRLYWPDPWLDYAARYRVPSRECCEPLLYATYDNFCEETKLELSRSGIAIE